MRGDNLGPFHGVPYTLKDCIETTGMRMSLGSKIYNDYVSQQDAEVYTRLKAAGGILLGKTNMPEFALWWETNNEVFGLTRNPWNLERTAGGSSGGEVAAIAAGLSPFGLGTDLGGSIRAPASLCGVVGIKPTLGRIPYTGIQPQTLHRAIHVGPIARTVGDVALGMSILAGADDVDIYTPPVPVPDYAPLDVDLTQLKVGWSPTTGVPVEPEVQRSVAEAAAAMGELGMNVEQVEIPALTEKNASAISTIIYTMEARRYSAPTIAGRESELTPMFRARFVDGNTFTMDEYLSAAQDWEDLRQAVKEYFTRYDIFLCPHGAHASIPPRAERVPHRGPHLSGQAHPTHHPALGPDRLTGHLSPLRLQLRRPPDRRPSSRPPLRRVDAAASSPRPGSQQTPDAAPAAGLTSNGRGADIFLCNRHQRPIVTPAQAGVQYLPIDRNKHGHEQG